MRRLRRSSHSGCRASGRCRLRLRQTGPQSWDIVAETDNGTMMLSEGGAKLSIDGRLVHDEPEREYPMLYRRFAEIVKAGKSDVDLAPLRMSPTLSCSASATSWTRFSIERHSICISRIG